MMLTGTTEPDTGVLSNFKMRIRTPGYVVDNAPRMGTRSTDFGEEKNNTALKTMLI
jgi:hypothetical protein